MSNAPEQRRLAAITFTDIVGYSVLSQHDDNLAQELLEEHREFQFMSKIVVSLAAKE